MVVKKNKQLKAIVFVKKKSEKEYHEKVGTCNIDSNKYFYEIFYGESKQKFQLTSRTIII